MLISHLYCINMTLRVKHYIYLNQDVLRLIMLESTIEMNQYFKKNNLPILSYDFHQYYPSYPYLWYKEYQYTHYAIHNTKQLWLQNKSYYQSAIIGYLRINDDLSWLPKQIMNALDDCLYEHHELPNLSKCWYRKLSML